MLAMCRKSAKSLWRAVLEGSSMEFRDKGRENFDAKASSK